MIDSTRLLVDKGMCEDALLESDPVHRLERLTGTGELSVPCRLLNVLLE